MPVFKTGAINHSANSPLTLLSHYFKRTIAAFSSPSYRLRPDTDFRIHSQWKSDTRVLARRFLNSSGPGLCQVESAAEISALLYALLLTVLLSADESSYTVDRLSGRDLCKNSSVCRFFVSILIFAG